MMKKLIAMLIVVTMTLQSAIGPFSIILGSDSFSPADECFVMSDDAYDVLINDCYILSHDAEYDSNRNRLAQIANNIVNSFPLGGLGGNAVLYPSYFGGTYIDHNGNLVVLIADDDLSRFDSFIGDQEGVKVRAVDFSFAELHYTMFYMMGVRSGVNTIPYINNLANGWDIDVRRNQVLVWLIEYTPESIALFKSTVLDSPMVTLLPWYFGVDEEYYMLDQVYSPEKTNELMFESSVEEFGLEFVLNHDRSVEIANAILDSFSRHICEDDMHSRHVRGLQTIHCCLGAITRTSYPSYFGGLYIADDGNLVMQIVGDELFRFDAFSAYGENIHVESVRFSYNELLDVIHSLRIIHAHIPDNTPNPLVSGWYLDVIGNRVVVELVDYS